ncbi:hypothetical protein ZWY2020_053722 [Hordeum vulgare]|uniref:Predicted protein n=1 Tax=Hordeum vulgare subsp. vulgare TaxID=112509 RepID=F2DU55_HORVV|nr:hypothetical protein ZWY2020_053722 [Hordeum vulgare]BAJ98626.1 predicted protein [Hordeum vulgare subsp. vulgare]BAK01411.1 predicted protein [Hordeum vulgare subsp. vulgare]
MGRTLDVLLGRTTKQTARLRSLLHLATRRVAVVRAHREVRCAQARGDVEQLLRQGHPDRALLRAEQVIRERDTLDALLLLDAYCALLADRSALLDAAHGRECPAELREAAAGLCYAAARCGDLPELQEARALLAAKFGRGFASGAAELRGGCGVSAKLVQKLATTLPSLESRQMVLLEIGAEKEIPVRLHNDATAAAEHEDPAGRSRHGHGHRKMRHDDDDERRADSDEPEGDRAVSAHSKLTFKDVEEAAQAAFESAATAAAAAKAAIELSRAGSGSPDGSYRRKAHAADETHHRGDDLADGKALERIGHVRNYSSDAEDLPEKRGEQQDTPRSRPASVRTNRGL